MTLSQNAVISREKLVKYLLVKRAIGDKSAFLKKAGYDLTNADILENDIRKQILNRIPVLVEKTDYGDLYEIRGSLTGPTGLVLDIVSIWMVEFQTKLTKFITLYPDKRKEI